jgi:hypothetical protein
MNLKNILWVRNTGKIVPDAPIADNLLGLKLGGGGVITTATGNPVSIITSKAQNAISTILSFGASTEGISEINLNGCGKNLLSKSFGQWSTIPNTLSECYFIKAGTYIFSFGSTDATSWRFGVRMKDENGNDLSTAEYRPNQYMSYNPSVHGWYWGTNISQKSFVLTIVRDCYIRIVFGSGDTTSSTVFDEAQLEFGTTATTYEPYTQGANITVNLGDTFFNGGTVDLENGELTADGNTYSITPQTVALLEGNNTLWTDGDEISITYKAKK